MSAALPGVDAGLRAVVLVEGERELPSLRILQQQPAQQGRSPHDQLHRFMGSRSGRKQRYARLMAGALDLDRVPAALNGVLDHVRPAVGTVERHGRR